MWGAIFKAAAIFSNTEQGAKLHELAKMTSPLQFIFGKEFSDEMLHDMPWAMLQSYGQATSGAGGGGGGIDDAGGAMSFFKSFGL